MKKFFTAILPLALLAGCETPEPSGIQPFMTKERCISAAMKEYAKTMGKTNSIDKLPAIQAIDVECAPEDFQEAFQAHVKARENFVSLCTDYYKGQKDSRKSVVSDSYQFMDNYKSDPQRAIRILKSQWPDIADELGGAFEKMEESKLRLFKSAAKYGVRAN